jgi:hypothetical protein
MHEKMEQLLERHKAELLRLQRELECLEHIQLPQGLLNKASVFRAPLFGSEGRVTFKAIELLDEKELLLIASRLSPYEPLVRCKQGLTVTFATVPPLPVVDAEIGPVLIDVDHDAQLTMRWVTRIGSTGLWTIRVEFPRNWGKNWIGHRSLERAQVRNDSIAYEHRPVTRCEWVPGAIPLRHVVRYSGGSAEAPTTFVLQFERDWDPLRLLTTVLSSV